jgi:hypothetical protein
MELDNRTSWRTEHLRAFVETVAELHLPRRAVARLRVRVVYRRDRNTTRPGFVAGRAELGSWDRPGREVTLKVSRSEIEPESLAQTIAHEIAHLRGLHHRQMAGDPRYTTTGDAMRAWYAWTRTLPLDRASDARAAREDDRARAERLRARAVELIDLGYRALAMRLHPDRGGPPAAMTELNRLRDDLKAIVATTRRLG